MKCEYFYCDNKIDKINCVISGINEKHKTFWCSEECYQNHINGIKPSSKNIGEKKHD